MPRPTIAALPSFGLPKRLSSSFGMSSSRVSQRATPDGKAPPFTDDTPEVTAEDEARAACEAGHFLRLKVSGMLFCLGWGLFLLGLAPLVAVVVRGKPADAASQKKARS